MKFKIPKTFRICGIDHPVEISSTLSAQRHLRGECEYLTRKVTLDAALAPDWLRRTFIHEALHQIDDVFDVGLKESQNKRLATGLAELVAQLEPEA